MKKNSIRLWVIFLVVAMSNNILKAQHPKQPLAAEKQPDLTTLNRDTTMMVRIAEIEILPEYLEEYKAILKVESEASVKVEPGVICIFPMYQKENPTQIRLLEIYASKVAYQSHLQTPHFQHYKTTTLKMVKSLRLVEMHTINPEAMQEIFRKYR